MAFKGTYQFVEVDVDEDKGYVLVATLDERKAANPATSIGVVVDMSNQIDRILVVGDDAFQMGKMSKKQDWISLEYPTHPLRKLEGFGVYDITKKK